MKQQALAMRIGCLGILTMVIVAAMLGWSPILDAMFGLAYCLDGYGRCPWQ
ncbi:hypothetical protein [Qipengyuania gaetbuli]|uniref:hypothetical protein n=1 Tax=Qipengyuania gaetbuli TaxID=266952 RepID=UPI001CFE2201|nr:hypothetical protein [Qipengyuania gaetbuli]